MARNYQLTINESALEHYEEIKEYLMGFEPNYFYSCIEENKRGSLHIHIYVQFPRQIRLSTRKTHGAHIEICKGSPQDNKDYIDKIKRAYQVDNVLEELGAMRLGGIKTDLAKSLMELELEDVTKSDFNIWKEVHSVKSLTPKELYKPDVKVYFIWGPSNQGKSKWIFDHFPDTRMDRLKYANGFWLGVNRYEQIEACWYDDWRDSHMPASEFINFIDYYRNQMNVKNCPSWINNYKLIFITSIQDPKKIYSNVTEEQREQWSRRITEINIEDYNAKKNFFKIKDNKSDEEKNNEND